MSITYNPRSFRALTSSAFAFGTFSVPSASFGTPYAILGFTLQPWFGGGADVLLVGLTMQAVERIVARRLAVLNL